jgi:hypothetical protein
MTSTCLLIKNWLDVSWCKCLSHVAKSRLLEEIIIQLRKKGIEIPSNVMSDLKSARTLIKIEKADAKGSGETEPKIDQYISNVEAYVITEAGRYFSAEKVEKWLSALDLASCDACVSIEEPTEETRFISGVPRDQKWIRVEPIASLPVATLEEMAKETKLGFQREKDGHLIVFGTPENISTFVKKMTQNARN